MKNAFTPEFLEWIYDVDCRLVEKYEGDMYDERRILSRTLKLSEEVGELSEAILSYRNDQRTEKLRNVVFRYKLFITRCFWC